MTPTLTEEQQRLVIGNMGLANMIADRLRRTGGVYDRADRETIISGAYEGLVEAARRYDPAHGNGFGVYAGFWIRHFIQKAVAESGAISIPRPYVQGGQANHRRECMYAFNPVEIGTRENDYADTPGWIPQSRESAPGHAYDEQEACERILRVLPGRLRDVARKRFVEGWALWEIARFYGFTHQRAQQMVTRSLKILQEKTEEVTA